MEKVEIREYRGCHGLERFVRMEDGSLCPEGLEEEVREARVGVREGPRPSASMGGGWGNIAGSVLGRRRG